MKKVFGILLLTILLTSLVLVAAQEENQWDVDSNEPDNEPNTEPDNIPDSSSNSSFNNSKITNNIPKLNNLTLPKIPKTNGTKASSNDSGLVTPVLAGEITIPDSLHILARAVLGIPNSLPISPISLWWFFFAAISWICTVLLFYYILEYTAFSAAWARWTIILSLSGLFHVFSVPIRTVGYLIKWFTGSGAPKWYVILLIVLGLIILLAIFGFITKKTKRSRGVTNAIIVREQRNIANELNKNIINANADAGEKALATTTKAIVPASKGIVPASKGIVPASKGIVPATKAIVLRDPSMPPPPQNPSKGTFAGMDKATAEKHYWKMSIKYHPDKNPGNAAAARAMSDLNAEKTAHWKDSGWN